jgi:hypothetical protein
MIREQFSVEPANSAHPSISGNLQRPHIVDIHTCAVCASCVVLGELAFSKQTKAARNTIHLDGIAIAQAGDIGQA